jgi:hypothetical protein
MYSKAFLRGVFVSFVAVSLHAATIQDDFTDGDTVGWRAQGDWFVEDGEAVTNAVGSDAETMSFLVMGDMSWTDYTIEARFKAVQSIGWDGPSMGFIARCNPAALRVIGRAYGTRLDNGLGGERSYPEGPLGPNRLVFGFNAVYGQWYWFKLEVKGADFAFYIDDQLMGQVNDPSLLSGSVGVMATAMLVHVDDITITTPEPENDCDNYPDDPDTDGDGFQDGCDNCPLVANPDQVDMDNDGAGDACDICPTRSDPGQEDSDGDGLGDVCDNCRAVPNPDQMDSDGDRIGDLCDNCPHKLSWNQKDADGDGLGDVCDNCPEVHNPDQSDTNGDGLGDACDVSATPRFRRGDSNLDGGVDLSDAVFTLTALFLGGAAPVCPDAADANDDGSLDISDAISTLGHLFLGGEAPPAPGPLACGFDPTEDVLPSCSSTCF